MAASGVDLGLLTETKITDDIYTCFLSGYNVTTTNAVSTCQGGIALHEVKKVALHGSNVLTFMLVMGQVQYFVMGAYIPPSNPGTMLGHIC